MQWPPPLGLLVPVNEICCNRDLVTADASNRAPVMDGTLTTVATDVRIPGVGAFNSNK